MYLAHRSPSQIVSHNVGSSAGLRKPMDSVLSLKGVSLLLGVGLN